MILKAGKLFIRWVRLKKFNWGIECQKEKKQKREKERKEKLKEQKQKLGSKQLKNND